MLAQVHGRVVNPRPVAKIKTGRVSQPITDAAQATGRDRSWIATRPTWQLTAKLKFFGICNKL